MFIITADWGNENSWKKKNTNLAKNVEGKAGGWEVHSGFEKLQHIHENQEDHTPITELYLYSRKYWEGPNLSFPADFDIQCKQELQAKAEQSTSCRNIKNMAHVHTEPFGKSWKTQWFQTLKKNVWSSTDH